MLLEQIDWTAGQTRRTLHGVRGPPASTAVSLVYRSMGDTQHHGRGKYVSELKQHIRRHLQAMQEHDDGLWRDLGQVQLFRGN